MPDIPSTAIACPNCRQPMQAQELDRHDQGTVRVDLCFACAGIWFDHLASPQLAPAAVIELFKEIYAHRSDGPHPLGSQLSCPRCSEGLLLSYDLGKAGRFSYFRCARGDGRFTPFFQFLREKQFVRSLSPAELQRVRAQVRQITCSQCGAPVDLETMTECKYCHAPIAFLDPDAVEKAMHLWTEAASNRPRAPAPEAVQKVLSTLNLNPSSAPSSGLFPDRMLLPASHASSAGLALDLVALGIHAIGKIFVDR